MADEPDNVVPIIGKNGRKLSGAALQVVGKPMTEERKAAMAAGRARAKAERDALKAADKATRSVTKKEAKDTALERLKPQAIKVLEEIIQTRTGVECPECGCQVSKPLATAQQLITTAKAVLEHTEGRPAQKIQVERVDVIEYRVADYETDAASA